MNYQDDEDEEVFEEMPTTRTRKVTNVRANSGQRDMVKAADKLGERLMDVREKIAALKAEEKDLKNQISDILPKVGIEDGEGRTRFVGKKTTVLRYRSVTSSVDVEQAESLAERKGLNRRDYMTMQFDLDKFTNLVSAGKISPKELSSVVVERVSYSTRVDPVEGQNEPKVTRTRRS